MAEHYQLLVRGGSSSTDRATRRLADVAARDGRIAAVGRWTTRRPTTEIDAEGRIVAPGIIDPHTHYDPQITWDLRHGFVLPRGDDGARRERGSLGSPTRPDDRRFFAGLFTRSKAWSRRPRRDRAGIRDVPRVPVEPGAAGSA